jgi:ABC-2 type transport system permease protein
VSESLALVGRYFAISVRAQMQYRASFVLSVLGQLSVTGIDVVGLWALFDRFGTIRGWSLPQVALLYGVVNVAFALADALGTGFDKFGSLFVKTGNFDRLLLRPRSTVLQLLGHELALRRVGRLTTGLVLFTWGAIQLDLAWGAFEVGLLTITIVGGACLFFGILVLTATASFWSTEGLEVWNVLTYGGVEMAQYPLTIYGRWFQRFFIYLVPISCVTYFPLVAVMGLDDPLGTTRAFQIAAPLAGPLFLALTFQLWKLGVRHYTSTGS